MRPVTERPASGSAAERVASLLMAFGAKDSADDQYSVSELARMVGRERSQVSRMLKALARAGLVEQDPDRRTYRLSWRVQVLAARSSRLPMLQAVRPILRHLVANTQEVALLSVQQGQHSLTVAREDAHRSLQAGGWVGRSSPMHCTASGRALLVDSPPELVEALTRADLANAPGPQAPTTIAELHQRLTNERAQGYATAVEEVEIGLTSIGVPVRGALGEIIAALNISGPTSRLAANIDETAALVRASATKLSRILQQPARHDGGQSTTGRSRISHHTLRRTANDVR